MATKYTLYFTDTSKAAFDLQSYTTNGPESPSDPSIIAGATGATTTLKLWGKGLPEYGEPIFQNLVYMLENFADGTAPVFPIEGQLWYNNATAGSPPTQPKLLVNDGTDFDTAVILSNGASAMTGELFLAPSPAIPSSGLVATSRDYVQAFAAPVSHQHVIADLPLITATDAEINYSVGVTSDIQPQLNDKISRLGDTMTGTADLTFSGGEVLGLPNSPSVFNAAASRQYVDDEVAFALAGAGDGALTSTEWLNNGLGSPLPNTLENTLRLTVSFPGSPAPTVTFDAFGISRAGHVHAATEITIDNSFDIAYGANVQTAIEQAASEIELLKSGGLPPSATITVQRIFEVLAADLIVGSPIDTFTTQNHFVDDNRVSISVNGVKQYAHTHGSQAITYSTLITDASPTGLDSAQTYNFAIAVDGGIATTITITGGSPNDILTHGGLISTINAQLSGLDVEISIGSDGVTEIFETTSSGTGSSVAITDPGGSPAIYLFAGGSPLGLDDFVEVSTAVDGIEGDYTETDINGAPVATSGFSSYVVFNYDILTGAKIESLLYV